MYDICIDDLFFEWDPDKDKLNTKKHGICFEIAKRVFLDEDRLELFDDKHSSAGDERYITIGMIKDISRLIVLVYTVRGDNIRIISARSADSDEEVFYNGYDKNKN